VDQARILRDTELGRAWSAASTTSAWRFVTSTWAPPGTKRCWASAGGPVRRDARGTGPSGVLRWRSGGAANTIDGAAVLVFRDPDNIQLELFADPQSVPGRAW